MLLNLRDGAPDLLGNLRPEWARCYGRTHPSAGEGCKYPCDEGFNSTVAPRPEKTGQDGHSHESSISAPLSFKPSITL